MVSSVAAATSKEASRHASGGGGDAAAGEATAPQGSGLTRERQVHHVCRLLILRGKQAAAEIQQRIDSGKGVTAKGQHFDVDVLKEALKEWSAKGGADGVPRPTPPPSASRAPKDQPDVPAPAAAKDPAAKLVQGRLSFGATAPAGGGGGKATDATPRPTLPVSSTSPARRGRSDAGRGRDATPVDGQPRRGRPKRKLTPEGDGESMEVTPPPSAATTSAAQPPRAAAPAPRGKAVKRATPDPPPKDVPAPREEPPRGSLRARLAQRTGASADVDEMGLPRATATPCRGAADGAATARGGHPHASEIIDDSDSFGDHSNDSSTISAGTPPSLRRSKTAEFPPARRWVPERAAGTPAQPKWDAAAAAAPRAAASTTGAYTREERHSQAPPKWGAAASAAPRAAASSTGARAREPSPVGSPRRAPPSPTPDPGAAPAPPQPPANHSAGRSVRELKALLSTSGLDFSSCVEKSDLEALWSRFELFRARPLEELRASCAAAGGPRFGTADECARFLIAPTPTSAPASTAAPPPQSAQAPSAAYGPGVKTFGLDWKKNPPKAESPPQAQRRTSTSLISGDDDVQHRGPEAMAREADGLQEAMRILGLRRDRHYTAAAWGFSVLQVPAATRDLASVQRAYRNLMRKLHPDKAGCGPEVAKAAELAREAKDACERGLSREEPPGMPHDLRCEPLCMTPGRRRFKLQWSAPRSCEAAPVRRYVVAALDPAYGRPLTVAVLEPDYSEEFHRFVSVEELTSYILAEEDLQKMPMLWKQSHASVQVAAANEAGQSPWSVLQVPISMAAVQSQSFQSAPSRGSVSPPHGADNDQGDFVPASFELEVRRRHGADLRSWLNSQRKAPLAAWLRSVRWPSTGSKEELVARVIYVIEGTTPGPR